MIVNVDKAVPDPAAFSTHQGTFCGLAGGIAIIENEDLFVTILRNLSCIMYQSKFVASGTTVEQWCGRSQSDVPSKN